MKPHILSIDQGTSSTKTLIFDRQGNVAAWASEPLRSIFCERGFVEQEPEEIYRTVLASVKQCLHSFKSQDGNVNSIQSCGISNQRETFVVWDEHGTPLHNAVAWQCKRPADICGRLEKEGLNDIIRVKTGLMIDPCFSGSKLIWLYENVEKARTAIKEGKAYFGTIDAWLLFKLTKGSSYLTDYTNASRTLLFNLRSLSWDPELLETFGLSKLNLPKPQPSSYSFGQTDFEGLLNTPININAMIGDSHAAAVGEGCFSAGTAKATMGAGCSILMNVGGSPKDPGHGMVSTVCWSMEGRVDYAVEGVIASCGSIIDWLKNQLGLFAESKQAEAMAQAVPDSGGVYLIPAFNGLGAPFWQMNREASVNGLKFASSKNHIIRAALESVAFQVKDILTAMEEDTGIPLKKLMVNGGMASNQFLLQLTANLLGKTLGVKEMPDISALGAAYLAGLRSGIYRDPAHLQKFAKERFEIIPNQKNAKITEAYHRWRSAITGA